MHRELNLQELTIINRVGKILSRGYKFTNWDVHHSCAAPYRRELKASKILKAFGLTEEDVERGIFRKDEGIVGKVYRDGVPVFLPDIRGKVKESESFAAIPTKVEGEVSGVFAVFKDFGEESVERSVELLMGILNQEGEEWEEEKRPRIVGKSPVAKAIHFMSKRKEKPFITINWGMPLWHKDTTRR